MKTMLRRVVAMVCLMVAMVATVEAQDSFAYQAVIRNAKGELVSNQEISMQFSLIYEGHVVYSETHTPKTNQYGNVQVNVGEGTAVSGKFADVPWSSMKVMMKIEADPNGGNSYIDLGTIQLQPAPYAMYAPAAGAVSTIQADEPKSDSDALFEVKDKDGNVVFAVYRDGVCVFVDDADSTSNKAMRTGFAVAGRRAAKEGGEADIFSVTADGTQVFVSDEDTAGGKAMRTGFAVAGRRAAKDLNADLFTVSSTGTQIYINNDEDGDKAMRTGFAVAGRRAAKDDDKYLEINADGTRVYIDDDTIDNSGKAMRTGFAVAGRRAAKGDADNKYMEITADGTQIYVDDDGKAMRTGFAVAGRRAAKGESIKFFEVNSFGTKIYIDETAGKAMRTGFAVAGRRAAKDGNSNKYMVIDADGTRIYVDYEEAKAMRTGFAVAGRRAAKDAESNTILKVDNVEGTRAYIDDNEGKAMRTGFAVSGRRAAKDGDPDLMRITSEQSTLTATNFAMQDKQTSNNIMSITPENTKINTDSFVLTNTESDEHLFATNTEGAEVNANIVLLGEQAQSVESKLIADTLLSINEIVALQCAQTAAVLGEADGYQLLKIYGSDLFAPALSVDADGNSYILFDADGNVTSAFESAKAAVVMTDATTDTAKVLVWPLKQNNELTISFGVMTSDGTDKYVKVTAVVNSKAGVVRKVEVLAENGSVEVSGNQVYGEIVSLEAKNAEGYHFAQWSDGNTINPRTTRFTGAIAFTALFDINTYDIKVNPTEGGSVEGAGTYNYGDKATLKAIADEHYHFVSWNDGNTESERQIEVKADWELTPTFALDTFLVKFVNGSETLQSTYVKYGQKPVYEGKTPEKEADEENTYSFIGWSPEIAETTTVQGEQTYEAQFEAKERLNTVTITWIVDGARKETYWEAGEMPVYDKNGKLPTKAETEEFSYEFSHWDQEVVEATENAEYTAVFSEKKRTYAITFYDADGSLLKTVQVEYGTVPVYDENGNNPTKETDNYNSYVFSGWKEGELKSVTGTATYTAQYSSTPRKYTISTEVETIGSDKVGGSVSVEGDMTYGTTATLTAQPNDGYVFVYWGDNQDNTESARTVTIPDETTYTAVFAKVNKLTVKISQEGVGSVIVKDKDGKEIQLSEADVTVATLDGSTPQPTEWYAFIVKGEKVTLEAVANDGFVFKYWNDDQSLTTATLNNVEISEDVEYTAIFEKNLTLKYELCGGSMVDPNKPTTLTGPSWQGFAFYTAEDVKREGYEFDGWYEIYNEGEYSNKVTALPEMLASSTLTLYAKWNEKIVSNYQAKSFSVAEGKTVKFSQGNLQYQGSTNTWRFAEHQYDAVDIDKLAFSFIGPNYAEWIDHFGWGSSGYNGVQPYTRDYSETVTVGGVTKTIHNLLHISGMTGDNAQYDWGVHNTISNGGDANWRTLTMDEWLYLVNSRENAASLRAPARVNGYAGLVLLPDDWTEAPQGITFNTTLNGTGNTAWATNEYDAQQWAKMESAGAVFLPASGMQENDGVWQSASHNDSNGSTIYLYYWTASNGGLDRYDIKGAIYTCLGSTGSTVAGYYPNDGSYMPVRLVQDDPTEAHLYVDPDKDGDGLTAETALPSLAAALDEVKDGNLDWYIHVNGMLSSHVSQDVLGEISARSLTIEGSNPENDGFRATGENNAVMVIGPDNENFTVTLKNLKLTGGKNYSGDGEGALRIGKIYDDNNYVLKPTNVLLENVLITGNSVNNNTESPVGVGVYVHAGSKLTIGDGTQITGNTVGDAHVAVYNDGEIVMTGGMVGGNNGTDIFNKGSLTLNGQVVAGNVILTETGNKITLGSDFTATADTVAMILPANYPDGTNDVQVLECANTELLANVCGKFAVAPYQESQDDEPIYYLVNSNGNLEQGCAVLFMSDISSVNPISVAVLPVGSKISAPNTDVLTIPNGCEFDGWLRMKMDDATHMPTFSSIDFESYLVQATDDMILLCPEWTKTIYVQSGVEIGDGTSDHPFGSIAKAASDGMTGMTTNYILKINGQLSKQNLSGGVANSITIEGVDGSNAAISGNSNGTALTINTSVPVIIRNLKITGGAGSNSGVGINIAKGEVTLDEGVLITGNNTTNQSIVYCGSGTSLTMLNGSQISGNTAYSGAVYIDGGAFVMSGGTISENEGFAVYTLADFTMSGSAKIPPLVGDDESVTNTVFLVPGAKIIIGKDGLASDTDIVATITPDTYPENYPYDDELIVLAKENGSLELSETKRFDVADAMINSTFTYWDVDSDGALQQVAKYNFYNCVYEDESSLDNEHTVVKVPMYESVMSPQLEERTNYEFKGWYRVELDGDGHPEGLASEPTDFDYYTVDEYSYESFFAVWERDPIYVGQNNQSASQQKGTWASPYSSIETAVSNMNDKDADFVIKVIGTLEGMQQISSSLTSEKAHSLTIEGYYGIDEEETHEPQDELKNTEEDMGRVLYSTTEVPVTIRNLKITGGANMANMGSVYGTGIYIKGGEMTLDEGTLITGNSNEILSIIYCENAQLTMKDGCRITDNTAKKGAVYLTGSTFVMEGGEISNITGVLYDRQHSGYSGAVDVESNSTFEMRGGTISNITNSENEPALGVNAYGSNLTIKMSDDAQIAAENAVGLSLNIKINIDGDLKKDKVATILPTSGHIYNNEPVQVLDGDLTQYEKFAVVPDLDDNNWLIGSDGKLMPLVYFVQETGVEDNDYGQGGNDSNTGIKPGRLTAFKTIDKAIQTINGRNDDQHDYTIVICSPTTETINPVNLSSGSVIAQSLTFKGRKATNIENYTLSNVVVNTSMPVKFENLTIASIADANDEGQNIELRSGAKVTGYVQVVPSMQFTMLEGSEVGSIYSEGNLIMHGGEVTGRDTDSDGINDAYVQVAGDGTFTMSGTAKPNHVKADKIFIDGELKGENITILDLYDYEGSISQQVIVFTEGVTGTLPVSRFQLADDRYAIDDEGKVKKIVPTGAINGKFSVGEGKQVYFSQGNLQYKGETSEKWWFADNQYTTLGNSNLGPSATSNLDLFCWGTSGNNTGASVYQPWGTGTSNSQFYVGDNVSTNLSGLSDWGYNAIANGGNEEGLWRTLSKDEWNYLLESRGNAESLKGVAKVMGAIGLILLPDDWIQPQDVLFTPGTASINGADYYETINNYTDATQWSLMESAGAVFLPCEGSRVGSSSFNNTAGGCYWTSTVNGEGAYYVGINSNGVGIGTDGTRYSGANVRLAQDVEGSGGTSQTSSIDMQSVAGGTIASTYNVGNNENEFDYASNQTTIPDLLVSKNLVSQYEYEQLMTYYGVVKSEYSTLVPTEQGEDAKKSTPAYYVSWIDAIIYCNLRSEAENLTPVYSIHDVNSITKSGSPWTQYYNVAKDENGKYYFNIVWTEGIQYSSYDTDADAFAIDLSADGYRLPTSAEYNYFLQNTPGLITEGEYNEWCQNYTYSDSGTRVWFNGTNGTVETEDFKHCTRREEKLGFRIVRNAPAQQP